MSIHCVEERWGSRGDASVRAGRPCVRAAAHEASGVAMAGVGGNMAGDDRDDFGVNAPLIGGQAGSNSQLALVS